jgi:hypothetical protein
MVWKKIGKKRFKFKILRLAPSPKRSCSHFSLNFWVISAEPRVYLTDIDILAAASNRANFELLARPD